MANVVRTFVKVCTDPEWRNGEYTTQPHGLRLAAEVRWFMGRTPIQRFNEAPPLAKADEVLDQSVAKALKTSAANDVLYALEASRDYDLGRLWRRSKPRCSP